MIVLWVQPGVLARTLRPGYGSSPVKRFDIDHWVHEVKRFGIKSVICLLAKELELYEDVLREEGGLLGHYRAQGWVVHSVPVEENELFPFLLELEDLMAVEQAFLQSPIPVLIHGSAGLVRTAVAVIHLKQRGLVKGA